jgi:uncharacterized protein
VKWSVSVTKSVYETELTSGYAQIAKDVAIVEQFIQSKGFTKEQYTVSPVFSDLVYRNDANAPREYALRQVLEIGSNKVDEVTALAKSIQEVSARGVLIQPQSPEYTYSKLSELRVSLLAAAMVDARARANQIVSTGGGKIGKIKSSSSGVVQVLAPNSVSVDDYGAYDTMSKNKEVMVTVRATFELK